MNELVLTVAIVIFALVEEKIVWRFIEDNIDDKKDHNLEETIYRVLKQEQGGLIPYTEQVQTVGGNERNPIKWSVCVHYYGLVPPGGLKNPMKWQEIQDDTTNMTPIVQACWHRLQSKSLYTSLPIYLLPGEFTLTELQRAYEIVLGFKVEKKSFRRRLLDAGLLKETGNIRRASHRPAQLYSLIPQQPYFFPRMIEGIRETK